MTDKIEVECTECNARLAVPVAVEGKNIRCPKCQGIISVTAVKPFVPPTRKVQTTSQPETKRKRSAPAQPSAGRTKPAARPNRDARSTDGSKRKPNRSRPARGQRQRPVSGYDEDALFENQSFGSTASAPPKMPGRRKKKKKTNEPQQHSSDSDGGWSASYEGQRLMSIGFGVLMIVAGCGWIYAEAHYSDRIHFYPFFLVGGGFLNIARSCLAD